MNLATDRSSALLLSIGSGAVVGAALVRLGWFLALPLDYQITLVPDDAFYYIELARNFARLGTWTFDGQAPATGFHLLFAYLLAGLFRVWPGIRDGQLIALGAIVATALLGASSHLVGRAVQRDWGVPGVLGVVLVFTASVSLAQQTLLVESSLAVFFSSALLALLSRAAAGQRFSAGQAWGALALGLLANLSRSDFGLLVAFCAAGFGGLALRRKEARRPFALAVLATAGAALGVVAVSVHTLHWSGSWIQSSARMKQHWGALLGYDPAPFFRMLQKLFLGQSNHWTGRWTEAAAVGLLSGAGVVAAPLRRPRAIESGAPALAGAAAATLLGYALFYGQSSAAVQIWYLGNAIAPAAYLAGALTSFVDRRLLAAAAALCALSIAHNTAASLQPLWPYQPAMKAAGEYLRSHPDVQGVGAWNAGLIARFSGRPIVNLDGLVNDEIYPYATRGQLLDYVCLRQLRFVLDFAAMLEDPWLRARGGDADERLRALLVPQVTFLGTDPTARWHRSHLALYRLDARACSTPSTRIDELKDE